MKATLIGIGDEVLCGDIINTNSGFLAKELTNLGIEVVKHIVVSDEEDIMTKAFMDCINISDIFITTGGLGPTKDDMTKEVIATCLGLTLEENEEALKVVEKFFAKNKSKMTPNNYSQAIIPKGAKVLSNDRGTAPGVLIEKDNKIIIMLPGPPREMKHMFEVHIKEFLTKKLNKFFVVKDYMTTGLGESQIEYSLRKVLPDIKGVSVNTYFNESGVQLKAVSKAESEEEAVANLNIVDLIIKDNFSEVIYSEDNKGLAATLIDLLKENNLKVSFAESCTGGLLASIFTKIPEVSNVYSGSVVSYSNEIKNKVLDVKKETLEEYGAVSEECVVEMAKGVANLFESDCSISISGIAGPSGGSEEKPVGTVYISCYYKGETYWEKFEFSGDRTRVQSRSAYTAINYLRKIILKNID